ncbi:hypothetical protein RKLH11_1675 [Rhodobacteraceae bacterium KLH11]|nr:hypothetical protein RKLH11_1675 [Rhodobacteraceae bacterium KLH11]
MMAETFDDPSKVCILSGRFPRSEFLHPWNHYAYARRHGYTYISCDWPTAATNRYMTKFMYLKHYINHFDYVFWIDDDAFFIDHSKSLDAFIPKGDRLASFCKSPANKKIFTYLSSGQFLIRGGKRSEDFIDAILETSLDQVKTWWSEDLGMFTGGDQDAIVYLVHENDKYYDCIELFNYMQFNSRLADLNETPNDVFLLHFTGPRETKIAHAKTAAKILKSGPSLVPEHLEKELLGGRGMRSILNAMRTELWLPEPKKRKSKPFKRLKNLLGRAS